MSGNVLNREFSEPVDGIKFARIDIHAGDGNMVIDTLGASEPVLLSGTLQYLDTQGLPVTNVVRNDEQAELILRGGQSRRPWFHLPWSACNGATEWKIHCNPAVSTDLTAHSDGGNLRLDLAGMFVRSVDAETGGGNIDLIMPEDGADLTLVVKTGAGNVTIDLGRRMAGKNTIDAGSGAGNVKITIPRGILARIHAVSGLGGTSVDPAYPRTEKDTYQSPGFDSAVDRIEIDAKSGAGVVMIETI